MFSNLFKLDESEARLGEGARVVSPGVQYRDCPVLSRSEL